ncbi:MAG: DUF2796 domain-containing protein [Hyphomicrobiaceae bacterium]
MRASLAVVLAVAAATGVHAQEARREVGAHAHGEGRLSIAIEGGRVELELEVPAADIVGFEHAPSNAGQRKAIADAKARLGKALTLFVPAPGANCRLATATVEVIGAAAAGAAKSGGHGHDHDHDHKNAASGHGKVEKGTPAAKAGEPAGAPAHSEFRATYRLDCGKTAALASLGLEYFKAFKGAEKLDVTVIGPKGQSSFVVTRAKPVLDLGGLS